MFTKTGTKTGFGNIRGIKSSLKLSKFDIAHQIPNIFRQIESESGAYSTVTTICACGKKSRLNIRASVHVIR